MDEKFNSILSVILIPQVVELIIRKWDFDEQTALNEFYISKTYESLTTEETKVWHFSPLTIYSMWEYEKNTGKLVFPEE